MIESTETPRREATLCLRHYFLSRNPLSMPNRMRYLEFALTRLCCFLPLHLDERTYRGDQRLAIRWLMSVSR